MQKGTKENEKKRKKNVYIYTYVCCVVVYTDQTTYIIISRVSELFIYLVRFEKLYLCLEVMNNL